MKEPPLVHCPKCNKDTLARTIGGAGVIFKGTGFYHTDYKRPGSKEESKSKKKKGEKKTDSSTPPPSPESASSDSKPPETKKG